MAKHNLRTLQKMKGAKKIQMLTCYDYPTAQMLNLTNLDLILVGDSLANVVLGHPTTIHATLNEMIVFSSAVKRGAPDKFVIADMPFGSYSTITQGIKSATKLFQQTGVEAIKLEGAHNYQLKLIKRLTEIGIPVMGHIGLRPQSVHQQGGYHMHGKANDESAALFEEAKNLEAAGCFSIVLECVEEKLSEKISNSLGITTIGIGSGSKTDGQVLVINDLLQLNLGKVPSFCQPIANLFEEKRKLIEGYLKK